MKLPIYLICVLSTGAIAGPYDVILKPSSVDASPYAYTPSSITRTDPVPIPVGSGFTLINDLGNGSYSTFSTETGLTLINNNSGYTTITPADNRPMGVCSGSSCFQP